MALLLLSCQGREPSISWVKVLDQAWRVPLFSFIPPTPGHSAETPCFSPFPSHRD